MAPEAMLLCARTFDFHYQRQKPSWLSLDVPTGRAARRSQIPLKALDQISFRCGRLRTSRCRPVLHVAALNRQSLWPFVRVASTEVGALFICAHADVLANCLDFRLVKFLWSTWYIFCTRS